MHWADKKRVGLFFRTHCIYGVHEISQAAEKNVSVQIETTVGFWRDTPIGSRRVILLVIAERYLLYSLKRTREIVQLPASGVANHMHNTQSRTEIRTRHSFRLIYFTVFCI